MWVRGKFIKYVGAVSPGTRGWARRANACARECGVKHYAEKGCKHWRFRKVRIRVR
jgi:hypothetical protein